MPISYMIIATMKNITKRWVPWKTTSWSKAILYDFSVSWMQEVLAIIVNIALAMICTGTWWGCAAAVLMFVALYRLVPAPLHSSLTMYHLWASVLLSVTFYLGVGAGLGHILGVYAGLTVLPSVMHAGLAVIAWVSVHVPYQQGRSTMMARLLLLGFVAAVFSHSVPGASASLVFVTCLMLSSAWVAVPWQSNKPLFLVRGAAAVIAYLAISGVWGLSLCLSVGMILEGQAYFKHRKQKSKHAQRMEVQSDAQDNQCGEKCLSSSGQESQLSLSEQKDLLLRFLVSYEQGHALFGGLLPLRIGGLDEGTFNAGVHKERVAKVLKGLQTSENDGISSELKQGGGIDALVHHDEWLVHRLFWLTRSRDDDGEVKRIAAMLSVRVQEIYHVVTLHEEGVFHQSKLQVGENTLSALSTESGETSDESYSRDSMEGDDVYSDENTLQSHSEEKLSIRWLLNVIHKIALVCNDERNLIDDAAVIQMRQIKGKAVNADQGADAERATWMTAEYLHDCNPVIADLLGLRSGMQDATDGLLLRWLSLLPGVESAVEDCLPIKEWARAAVGRLLHIKFTVRNRFDDGNVNLKHGVWDEKKEIFFSDLSKIGLAKQKQNILVQRILFPVAMDYFASLQCGEFKSPEEGSKMRKLWYSSIDQEVLRTYELHIGYKYLIKDEGEIESSFNIEENPDISMSKVYSLETNSPQSEDGESEGLPISMVNPLQGQW